MRSKAAEAPVLEKFDEYLVDFQLDLKKIIGKHRHDYHYWSADELLSEINLRLFSKKEDIINCEGQVFNRVNFGKVAYAYAKNLIVWTHCRDKSSAYRRRMADGVHHTEEGEKTTFEVACELQGMEEEGFEAFDCSAKSQYVVKLIREYAHILTERELVVLRLMTKEMNQEEMGKELGVTHQAISIAMINISSKIKNYLDFDYKTDASADKVTKGFDAIRSFFNEGLEPVMSQAERDKLLSFLLENSGKYTFEGLAGKFEGGKFFWQTIRSFVNFSKLTQHVALRERPSNTGYSEDEVAMILKLAKKGRSIEGICEELSRSVLQISAKCSHLIKIGRLDGRPHRRDALVGQTK